MNVHTGRYTAHTDDEFVVFLIGMRINSLRGLPNGLRAFASMPPMLAALARDPSLGCLGGHFALGWLSATVVQYWRSFEDLERFAREPAQAHLPAWRWFNRLRRSSEGVGIWHETYKVPAGAYEAVYVNMPRFGLAAATAHGPVDTRRGDTARERLEAADRARPSAGVP